MNDSDLRQLVIDELEFEPSLDASNIGIAAKSGMIDDVIDPRQTREIVCRGFEMASTKQIERPWKRQGVVPV